MDDLEGSGELNTKSAVVRHGRARYQDAKVKIWRSGSLPLRALMGSTPCFANINPTKGPTTARRKLQVL